MVRLLVVEDSPTARALLIAALSADPDIVVVGEAEDGLEAIALAISLRPDVITMDVDLPRLDGYSATKRIMTEAPAPVVIVTGLDVRDVERSLALLQVGAVALVPKPPAPTSPGFDRARRELGEMIKAMAEVKVVRHRGAASRRVAPALTRPKGIEIVAIAASTGGPKILGELLGALPGNFRAPILLVQHIADGFTEGLASWLDANTPLSVRLAAEGERIAPATVHVAPEGLHLAVSSSGQIKLTKEPPIGGFRPAATALFESLAKSFGRGAAAVVLSGMGTDGARGAREMHARGGYVIAQDEASSLVHGMPSAVIDAGVAHEVLHPLAIAAALVEIVAGDSPSHDASPDRRR